ncbi:siderophore ferric iron reductase [Vibrio sp.]|nr:siderophore ferric iron reductase [Vibrio sp.]
MGTPSLTLRSLATSSSEMSPSRTVLFERLFHFAETLTPALKGEMLSSSTVPYVIKMNDECGGMINELYRRLQHHHPEAGKAYWLTRTWRLLTWQPIYLAFASIYGCQKVPALHSLEQRLDGAYIRGYQLPESDMKEGQQGTLIAFAAKELNVLFDHFYTEMNRSRRIGRGLVRQQLSDDILACIILMQKKMIQKEEKIRRESQFNNDYWLLQAARWLKAFNLPQSSLSGLSVDIMTNTLMLRRTGCCLVHKCAKKTYCETCPKHPKNKH